MTSGPARDFLVRRARPAMGTLIGVSLRGRDAGALERLSREVFAELARLEDLLSEFRPCSDVSRVNAAAGVAPVQVGPELIAILQIAERVSRASGGAFDVTWAALAPLWKFDAADFSLPSAEAVARARELVDFRQLAIDSAERTVFLQRSGMRLGLGGIAKAYAAERAADFAVSRGCGDVLVDAGGDVVCRGKNGERPWTVGVRHPRDAGKLVAAVELRDQSLVTSGDYEKFVERDGQRWHHLLDPRSGFPARRSRSATVLAPGGALADALATALFVLGSDGLAMVEQEFSEAAFLHIDADGAVRQRGAARPAFELFEQGAAQAPRRRKRSRR